VSPLSVAGTTFTFGAGGSFSGQAVRQEDYEFFLSFPIAIDELTKNPERTSVVYDGCRFPPGLPLESNLDIDSILERAVSPVRAGTLYTGHQVGPGSSSSPAIPANEAANIDTAFAELKKLAKPIPTNPATFAQTGDEAAKKRVNSILGQVDEKYKYQIQDYDPTAKANFINDKKDEVAKALANASKVEKNTQLVIKTVVTPIYDLATTIKLPAKCLSQMLSDQITAVGNGADVTVAKVKIDDADPNGDSSFHEEEATATSSPAPSNASARKIQMLLPCRVKRPTARSVPFRKPLRTPDTGIAKSTSPRTVSAISPASLRLGPPQPSRRSSANGSILRRRPIERGVSLRS
jgi:hypothetical protein